MFNEQTNDGLQYVDSWRDLYIDNLAITVYYPEGYTKDEMWSKDKVYERMNEFQYKDYEIKVAEILNSICIVKGFFCVNNGVSMRPVININVDEDKLRIHFHGLFFERMDILEDLKQVWEVEKLFFYNSYDVIKKVSRVDLATNVKTFMKNIKFLNPYGAKVKEESFGNKGDKPEMSWMACGSPKSKESAQLIIYDKREDQNHKKNHSIDRFGTYDYCRAEYRLPSQCLRKHGIESLVDLYLVQPNDWLLIWRTLASGKTYRFRNKELPPTNRPKYLKKVEVANYWENVKGQVVGILSKLPMKNFSEAVLLGSKELREQDNEKFIEFTSWLRDKSIANDKANFKRLGGRFI